MAETPQTIKLGGQLFIRTTDMKVKTLTKPTFNATTETLHDETGGNYQVPTGKIFKALEVSFIQSTDSTNDALNIRDATTADTANGSILLVLNTPANVPSKVNVSVDFIADRFPTAVSISAPLIWCLVIGIEMDV